MTAFDVVIVEPSRQRCWEPVCLTCSLSAEQILALRLIRVDCGDRHVVRRVRLQVLQEVGCLVVVQNGLMRKAKHGALKAAWQKKRTFSTRQEQGSDQSDNSWIKAKVCFCHVLAATAGEFSRVAGPEVFLCNRLRMDVHGISEIASFELTYWNAPSSFLVQPMR